MKHTLVNSGCQLLSKFIEGKSYKSQLEHGMELHKESFVFDTYGFQPTAALDSERMNALINAGASSLEIQDMRENMMMTNYINNPAEREEFENAWTASGVTCVFQKCRRRK